MNQYQRVRTYVYSTVAIAAAISAVVVVIGPALNTDFARAVVTLGAIALVANFLGYSPSRTLGGSVSLVPLLAMVALAPSWAAIAGTAALSVAVQLVRDNDRIKKLFNVAQHCLSLAVATFVYIVSGGKAMGHGSGTPYIQLALMFFAFTATNTICVAGVIALSEGRRFRDVWFPNFLGTLPYDVLSWPLIFTLAWVYTRWGVGGAGLFAVPLLGLRQLYKVNADLDRTNQELLELMVAAIEARDPYTSGHSRRVSEHARTIAEILGLRSSQVRRIEIAALLHDVGKIHENFAPILQKPGRLTDEENAIMQTHPIKSEELVAKVSQLRDIVPAVRGHHENWDGTGYPDGLAGERIPLASRIIMFADTIDAMTSDRPYRKALDPDAVRAELVKHRGRQFDPEICDALLSSGRYEELFKYSSHQSLPHTQEVPRLRLTASR